MNFKLISEIDETRGCCPAPRPAVVRDAIGEYHVDISPTTPGTHRYAWLIGKGTYRSGTFEVEGSVFV